MAQVDGCSLHKGMIRVHVGAAGQDLGWKAVKRACPSVGPLDCDWENCTRKTGQVRLPLLRFIIIII